MAVAWVGIVPITVNTLKMTQIFQNMLIFVVVEIPNSLLQRCTLLLLTSPIAPRPRCLTGRLEPHPSKREGTWEVWNLSPSSGGDPFHRRELW